MQTASPWLVVGLGNPGPKYAENRHNIGFMVVRAFAQGLVPSPSWSTKFKSKTATGNEPGIGRFVLLLPQNYMNCSGESVAPAASFHRIEPARVVVVHDEIDFDFGRVAVKKGGGHGGHNGLRDICDRLGTRDFARVRVGIGRPRHGDVSNWVLSDFAGEDRDSLPELVGRATDALVGVLREGVKSAMNKFNVVPD